jgi:cell division protein FtsB
MGSRRGAANPAPASSTRERTAAFTSRAAILTVVVCAVLLSLAYPLREYVAQRAEIERLQAQHRATERRVAALTRQQQRWNDPAYIKAQARERLHFVLPGETAYVVLDPGAGDGEAAGESPRLPPLQPDARSGPWYSQLWRSAQAADRPADPAER